MDQELEKCQTDCGVLGGSNCKFEMLDHPLDFKGEVKKVNNKTVKQNCHLFADDGSGFDTNFILYNIPQ